MSHLNGIDIVIVLFLIWQIYSSSQKGLFRIVFDIVTLYLATIGALRFYLPTAIWIHQTVALTSTIAKPLAFISVFILLVIGLHYFSVVLSKLLHKTTLASANIWGGAVAGAAKGLLIILIILFPISEWKWIPKPVANYVNHSVIVTISKPIAGSLLEKFKTKESFQLKLGTTNVFS